MEGPNPEFAFYGSKNDYTRTSTLLLPLSEVSTGTVSLAILALENFDNVIKALNEMKSEEGKITRQQFWKLKKKMFRKGRDPPAAVSDGRRNLIPSDKSIEEGALEVYSGRLKGRTSKSEFFCAVRILL